MRITFAWWNTSLSPIKRKNPPTDEEKEIALKLILQLIQEYQVDCLALGEITANDMVQIIHDGRLGKYGVHEPEKHERQQFDVGVLYRTDLLHKTVVEDPCVPMIYETLTP